MVESRQEEALALICLFPILAAIFVAARSYSRYLGQNAGWDDYLIQLALLLLAGETLVTYKYVIYSHTGFHAKDVPDQTVAEQVTALKWSFAVQMFYHPMMGAIRASIIMFLFRVKDPRWLVRLSLHLVFWINIGYMVSTTFVNIFQCDPLRYAYLRPEMDQVNANGDVVPGGKCINSLAFILASCGLSIFMDLIIIPIPTAMVWNLQMRLKTKIAVVVIMSMGWIATAVSVGRFVVYYYRFQPDNPDRTWDIGVTISIAEPSVGIIAACAPALKCLFRRLIPRYFTYEVTDYPTHTPTHDKSYPQRRSNNYREARNEAPNEEVYGMKPLGSVDSREQVGSLAAQVPTRTRSAKTGVSEGFSEPVEAEPKHFLNHGYP